MLLAKIHIQGLIGNTYNDDGTVKERGVELADVVTQVAANKDAEVLQFWINSEGGNVEVGKAIAAYIGSLNNAWTIAGDFCASMGTEIHLSVPLERRKKVAGGRYIIHNPWTTVSGNSSQLADASDVIAQYESDMLNMYHKATGLDKEALKGLMALETDLTDDQCTALKFVSEVLPKTELKAVATVKQTKKTNNLDMTKVAELIATGFADLKKGLGMKVATPAAKAATTIKKVVKAAVTVVKAEVLTTDADVSIYTDQPLADFIADPTKEVKAFSDEAMTLPMADGDYNLKDGSVIGIKSGMIEEVAPGGETEATVEELKAKIVELEAANAKISDEKDEEFKTLLAEAMTELKTELGSTYTPKAAVATTTATRQTTTKVAPNAKKTMKELAAERTAAYKGAKVEEKK